MNLRQRIRNSDALRESILRLLASKWLNRNGIYRSIYRRQILRRAQAGLIRPESVDIESSSFCNAKCIMCTHPQMTRKKGNMPWEIFEKAVQEAVAWGVPRIYLSGFGEPFIDKTLTRKIRRTKELGAPWVGCLTNGSLLSEKTVDEILESGLDEIAISMDGFSPETFNRIRAGLDFDQVTAGVTRLLTRRAGRPLPKVQIQVVLQPGNIHEKEKAKRLWAGKADQLAFRQIQSWGGAVNPEETGALFSPNTVENNKLYPCRYLWTQLNIKDNGDVTLCCLDWDAKMIVGNIREQSLQQVWRSPRLEQIRKLHLENRIAEVPLCKDCDFFSVWW